jgi:hypothetical protein
MLSNQSVDNDSEISTQFSQFRTICRSVDVVVTAVAAAVAAASMSDRMSCLSVKEVTLFVIDFINELDQFAVEVPSGLRQTRAEQSRVGNRDKTGEE